jgi:hypothetical protein
MRFPLIAALLLAAGCEKLPVKQPPGFGGGETAQQNSQLFFPSALAVMPDQTLLVANGNFSHAFAGGTLLSIGGDFIKAIFDDNGRLGIDCSQAGVDSGGVPCTHQLSEANAVLSGVLIGNYAGDIGMDDSLTDPARFFAGGGTAYISARDSNTIDAVRVAPGGGLTCVPGLGITPTDCRAGILNTSTALNADQKTPVNLDGPYTIVAGDTSISGQPSQRVMFVASLVPHVESIESGVPITTSEVAVLSQASPQIPLFTMIASGEFIGGNGAGIGPMLYDGVRRRLVLAGCYARFGGTGAGEPATSKCPNNGSNLLRFLSVDGSNTVLPTFYNLFGDVRSDDLSNMVFADPDPVTGAPTTLWATMRNPDVLVKIDLPVNQSVNPRVRLVIPVPGVPSQLVLIPRAQGDLIAVTVERAGAVVVVDTGTNQVVANVERIGDTPTGLKLFQMTNDTSSAPVARLVATAFAGCSVAFVEVPLNDPASSSLRGRIGACEE